MQGGTKRAPSFRAPARIKEFSYQDMSTKIRAKEYFVMCKRAGTDLQKLDIYSLGSPGIYMCDFRQADIFGFTLPA